MIKTETRFKGLQTRMANKEARRTIKGQLVGTVAGVYGLKTAFEKTIGASINFESVMGDVRKVVDFETPARFRKMGKQIPTLTTD